MGFIFKIPLFYVCVHVWGRGGGTLCVQYQRCPREGIRYHIAVTTDSCQPPDMDVGSELQRAASMLNRTMPLVL